MLQGFQERRSEESRRKNLSERVSDELRKLEVERIALERARTELGQGMVPRDQVELLRRRLAKLAEVVEAQERALARSSSLSEVDAGLGSIYSEVQGLDPEDARVELKREMMRTIFEANLKLRDSITIPRQAAE